MFGASYVLIVDKRFFNNFGRIWWTGSRRSYESIGRIKIICQHFRFQAMSGHVKAKRSFKVRRFCWGSFTFRRWGKLALWSEKCWRRQRRQCRIKLIGQCVVVYFSIVYFLKLRKSKFLSIVHLFIYFCINNIFLKKNYFFANTIFLIYDILILLIDWKDMLKKKKIICLLILFSWFIIF